MVPAESHAEAADAEGVQEAGLNALRAGDFEKAVELLGTAVEIKVKVHGELAPECAYTYFKYGAALLYKSQEERDVLGETAAAKERTASGAGLTEDKPRALEIPNSEAVASASRERKGKGPAKEEVEEEEEEEEGGDAKGEEDLEDGEGEEDESDLALAWEVLETARCIYERLPERSLDEADVIMMLADISQEKEEFTSCVADYNRALAVLHSVLPPHSRTLAEGYFRLCMAHQTAQQPLEALTSCQKAIDVCELWAEHLKQQLTRERSGAAPSSGEGFMAGQPGAKEMGAPSDDKPGTATGGADAAGDSSSKGAAEGGIGASEMEKELKEAGEVIADLREKEAELKEVLASPSLKHLLAASQVQQVPKDGTSGGSGIPELQEAEKTQSTTPQDSTGLVKQEAATGPVAVAGRGKKRVAPTPVDPAEQSSVKKLSS